MKGRILFLFILFGAASTFFGQHYSLLSNYINNGLLINPAFAGRNDALDVTLMHRNQWTGMNGAPTSNFFTVNSPIKTKAVNLGLSIIDDRIGATQTQNINGIYAYRFKAGNMNCSFGAQAGIDVLRANTSWDKLKRNDQNDDLLLGQQKTTVGLVTGAGYYMYNEVFTLGLSMPYVVNTNSKKSVANSPVMLNASYMFILRDSSAIKPSFLVRYINGSPVSYDINVSYYYKQKYGLGFSYRAKESLIAILEIPIQKQFKIYYSYDMGIGSLRKYHNGSHEIMIRYLLVKKKEEKPAETPVAPDPVIEK